MTALTLVIGGKRHFDKIKKKQQQIIKLKHKSLAELYFKYQKMRPNVASVCVQAWALSAISVYSN